MRHRLISVIGAAVLTVACLVAPGAALADVSTGDGGGGTVTGGSGGLTWIVGAFEKAPGCTGDEPEIGKTLQAPPNVGPNYWTNIFMFETWQQHSQEWVNSGATPGTRNPALLGQRHCKYVLNMDWGVTTPNICKVSKYVLARSYAEAGISLEPCPTDGSDPVIPKLNTTKEVGSLPLPKDRPSTSAPWPAAWETLHLQRTLTGVKWAIRTGPDVTSTPSKCVPEPNNQIASMRFKLVAVDCKYIRAMATWTLRAERTYSDGRASTFDNLTASGLATCDPDPTACTEPALAVPVEIVPAEVRAVYMDPGAKGGSTGDSGNALVDSSTGGSQSGNTGAFVPVRPSSSELRGTGLVGGVNTSIDASCRYGERCREREIASGPQAGRDVADPVSGVDPGRTTASRRSSAQSSSNGFDAKVGGLGLILVIVAAIAVASYFFFGRRQRL